MFLRILAEFADTIQNKKPNATADIEPSTSPLPKTTFDHERAEKIKIKTLTEAQVAKNTINLSVFTTPHQLKQKPKLSQETFTFIDFKTERVVRYL